MPRSAILVAFALFVLAGCLGPTAEPGATATPYPDEIVAFPDGPKDRPALPETITADSVSSYVKILEFRYSYNELWDGPGTEVGMSEHSCSVASTQRQGSGYLVTVDCTGYVNRPVNGAESTRTEHADLPPWSVRYYIDANTVARTEVE